PIQADPALATNALISLGPSGSLVFDGAPGHYLAVTGVVIGDVAFDRPGLTVVVGTVAAEAAVPGPPPTLLTLLTLARASNRPNYPTFVDLDFYNSNEQLLSANTEFICWQEIPLSGVNNGVLGVPAPPAPPLFINSTLTGQFMGTRKGIVISSPAEKIPVFG